MSTYTDLTLADVRSLTNAISGTQAGSQAISALTTPALLQAAGSTYTVEVGTANGGDHFITTAPGTDAYLADGTGGTSADARVDVLTGGTQPLFVSTGSLDDYVVYRAGGGDTFYQAGSGDRQYITGFDGDTLVSGTGTFQTMFGMSGTSIDISGFQNSAVLVEGGNTVVAGGSSTDVGSIITRAGSAGNYIRLEDGHYSVFGEGGSDTIIGGDGFADLTAGQSAGAADYIVLGEGGGRVVLSQGDNFAMSTGAQDTIYGGNGMDTLYGGGSSLVYSGAGQNILSGIGEDTLVGAGQSLLSSSGASSTVTIGAMGQDSVFGGAGSEVITTGEYSANQYVSINLTGQYGGGNDTIYGGGGSSDYVAVGRNGNLTFEGSNNDVLDFRDLTFSQLNIVQVDGTTVYSYSDASTGDSLTVTTTGEFTVNFRS